MVAFVRVTRDKRGYEHIYLMRGAGQRGKGASPRVLYVFRTPPGLKVGREPFDETTRRTLEEQNPGVHFDWQKLSVILPPPPDVEYWRERRRAEKAAKQARRVEEHEEAAAREGVSSADNQAEPDDSAFAEEEDAIPEMAVGQTEPTEAPAPASVNPADSATREGHRRRRRRRGGRGRRREARPGGLAQVPADSPNLPDDPAKER